MKHTRWEYMTLDIAVSGVVFGPRLDGDALTQKLNELGAEGWELVSFGPMTFGGGQTSDLIAVLKRPR